MEVKNLFVVVICIISQLYQIAYADLVPIHVKEVVEFCENNVFLRKVSSLANALLLFTIIV